MPRGTPKTLHVPATFHPATDRVDQRIRDGGFDSARAVELALDELRAAAQPLVEGLRHY